MARLIALALVRLRQALDADGWLRPPYHPDVQRALDLSAARNALSGTDVWPSTLAMLIRRASLRLSAWMPETRSWDEHGAFTEEPLLEREEPTVTCRELAAEIEGSSPEDELVEVKGFKDFRSACSARRDGQASYAVWRRFVVEHPVVCRWADELLASPALMSVPAVEEAFHVFYEPLARAFAPDGQVPICRVSGTVLRHNGNAFVTDSRDPEAVRLAEAGQCDFAHWSPHIRTLRRPFRMFWCLPGKSEVAVMDELRSAGWDVDAWPALDTVDLTATSPDGTRKVAVDVKDYGSPALLAARFQGFNGYERTHECFLVVPDAQLEADRTYGSVFANVRASYGKKPVKLRTVSRLVAELGAAA